jgi:hypothetical protein
MFSRKDDHSDPGRVTLRLKGRERSFIPQPDPESSFNLTYFDQNLSLGEIRQRDKSIQLFILTAYTTPSMTEMMDR